MTEAPVAPDVPSKRTYAQMLQDVYDLAVKWRHAQCTHPGGPCDETGHVGDCAVFQAELSLVLAIDRGVQGHDEAPALQSLTTR